MRFIHGISGCQKGDGVSELFDGAETTSVRVVDTADGQIAIRIGTHPESARLTPEEARHIGHLLADAADRADAKQESHT